MENKDKNTQKSLYERLGGEQGVRNIVKDVLEKNAGNPLIGHHFRNVDMSKLNQLVFEFFSMGTGGPNKYTGRDMRAAHTGMNINEDEWISATDDTICALDANGIGEREKNEVLTILESLKGEIVGV